MNVKKRMWQRGLLFLLLGLFFACPAFVSGAVTPYPYDQVGVIIGFSGVYDVWLFDKYWNSNQTAKTGPSDIPAWLDKIASHGGNIIRIFSHYNHTFNYNKQTISPWPKSVQGTKIVYDVDNWNPAYFTRLGNFMELLRTRKLKAWIDIWDYSSIKNSKYLTHPFWANNKKKESLGLAAFLNDPDIKIWRENFQYKLLSTTSKSIYTPIYSTNEVGIMGTLTKQATLNFLKEVTDYLHKAPWNIPYNRISHSSTLQSNPWYFYDALKTEYPNLLLSIHNKSRQDQISETFLTKYGIKVISSDGQLNGAIVGKKIDPTDPNSDYIWGTKHPLNAEQAFNSMGTALKFGFLGLEVLDRDEYKEGYEPENVNLDNIDVYNVDGEGSQPEVNDNIKLHTLNRMIDVCKVTIEYPNGGEQFYKGEINDIIWEKFPRGTDWEEWGTISLYLYQGNTKLGPIVENLAPSVFYYTWTVGSYIGGTAPIGSNYRIKIVRIKGNKETFYDFSNGYFSIVKPPPPVNAAN